MAIQGSFSLEAEQPAGGLEAVPSHTSASDIEDARARIAAALAARDIGTWLWDIREDAVRGDANLNSMFGLTSVPGSSRPISDYLAAIHPEDRAAVWGAISQAIADGNTDRYEAQYRLIASGVERWVHAQGLVRRNEIGVATDLSGVVRDISRQKLFDAQRRQLLDSIKQQARIFHAAMSSTRDWVFVVNPDGRVEYANRRLLDFWSLTIHEAVGRPLRELGFAQDLAVGLDAHIRQVIDTHSALADRLTYRDAAGVERRFEYALVPIFTDEGIIEFVGGSARETSSGV